MFEGERTDIYADHSNGEITSYEFVYWNGLQRRCFKSNLEKHKNIYFKYNLTVALHRFKVVKFQPVLISDSCEKI